jgi:hypothetical protein
MIENIKHGIIAFFILDFILAVLVGILTFCSNDV